MNILIANDDGYDALGIEILAKNLAKNHNVYVVAPNSQRSGASHAVSFFNGLTYKKVSFPNNILCYAISGTPADCVLFGIKKLLEDKKIDVVLSGINSVLNVGSDIMYSGTFGAAQEATFLQYKGIAVSVQKGREKDYQYASDFISTNLKVLMKYADCHTTINVNVPDLELGINGVKVAPIAFRPYEEQFILSLDENGKEYYQIHGKHIPLKNSGRHDDGTLIENGYITITPVKMLSNAPEVIEKMKEEGFNL